MMKLTIIVSMLNLVSFHITDVVIVVAGIIPPVVTVTLAGNAVLSVAIVTTCTARTTKTPYSFLALVTFP
jgi:hypothetical protein